MRRERPDNVPALTLMGLPEYVTSSEEEESEGEMQPETYEQHALAQSSGPQEQANYSQSMKYIENYYKKQQQEASDSHQYMQTPPSSN